MAELETSRHFFSTRLLTGFSKRLRFTLYFLFDIVENFFFFWHLLRLFLKFIKKFTSLNYVVYYLLTDNNPLRWHTPNNTVRIIVIVW